MPVKAGNAATAHRERRPLFVLDGDDFEIGARAVRAVNQAIHSGSIAP
jgi:hypothetical protein